MIDGPLCVFCGSDFPVELERCPTCARPWIDQRLSEVVDGAIIPLGDVATPADAQIDTEPGRRVPLWMIAAGVGLVALTLYGVVFSLLLDGAGSDAVASTTQTTVPNAGATPTPPTSAPPVTSAPPATTASPPSSTVATTTSTTTTTTITTLPPIAEGTPIPVGDLTLGAFALGPLNVGSNGDTALSRLAATFGQPTEIVALADGEAGLCTDDVGRLVAFGGLGIILVGEPGSEVFAGYVYTDVAGHPSSGLETLSGAGVGDTVAEVDAVYAGSIVAVGDVDEAPHLFILRSSDRRTLLWGPLDGAGNDAVLTGINAPYWCDDGPFLP